MQLPGDNYMYGRHITHYFWFPDVVVNLNEYQMTIVFLVECALDYVRQYRKIAESNFTSWKLPHWINLFFGVWVQNIRKCRTLSQFLSQNLWGGPIARTNQELTHSQNNLNFPRNRPTPGILVD
jgi:hypothetical protein